MVKMFVLLNKWLKTLGLKLRVGNKMGKVYVGSYSVLPHLQGNGQILGSYVGKM